MAKDHKLDRGIVIMVSLEDDDDNQYSVTATDFPDISGDDYFQLIQGVADVKFSRKNSTKSASANPNEEVTFNGNVKITVDIPDGIEDKFPEGKKLDDLQLGYYMDGKWHLFPEDDGAKVKTKIDKKNRTGTVKFKKWFIDPPVGWGFG